MADRPTNWTSAWATSSSSRPTRPRRSSRSSSANRRRTTARRCGCRSWAWAASQRSSPPGPNHRAPLRGRATRSSTSGPARSTGSTGSSSCGSPTGPLGVDDFHGGRPVRLPRPERRGRPRVGGGGSHRRRRRRPGHRAGAAGGGGTAHRCLAVSQAAVRLARSADAGVAALAAIGSTAVSSPRPRALVIVPIGVGVAIAAVLAVAISGGSQRPGRPVERSPGRRGRSGWCSLAGVISVTVCRARAALRARAPGRATRRGRPAG